MPPPPRRIRVDLLIMFSVYTFVYKIREKRIKLIGVQEEVVLDPFNIDSPPTRKKLFFVHKPMFKIEKWDRKMLVKMLKSDVGMILRKV